MDIIDIFNLPSWLIILSLILCISITLLINIYKTYHKIIENEFEEIFNMYNIDKENFIQKDNTKNYTTLEFMNKIPICIYPPDNTGLDLCITKQPTFYGITTYNYDFKVQHCSPETIKGLIKNILKEIKTKTTV